MNDFDDLVRSERSFQYARREANETNDCTVVALSHAYDIPYEKAHEICARYGRKTGEGFHFQAQIAIDLKESLRLIPSLFDKKVGKLTFSSNAVYLVLVKGHIFCVKHGKIMDSRDNSKDKIIRCWEVTK